jgi:hypothetical protein
MGIDPPVPVADELLEVVDSPPLPPDPVDVVEGSEPLLHAAQKRSETTEARRAKTDMGCRLPGEEGG